MVEQEELVQYIALFKKEDATIYESIIYLNRKKAINNLSAIYTILRREDRAASFENAHKLLHQLNIYFKGFVTHKKHSLGSISHNLNELQYLKQRQLPLFEKELKRTKKRIEEREESSDKLQYKFKVSEVANTYFTEINREHDASLLFLDQSIDELFLYQKIKNSCDLLNRQFIFKKEYDLSFIEAILAVIEENKLRSNKLVWLYYNTFQLLKKRTENQYQELIKSITRYRQQVDQQEFRNIYIYLQNFCIQQINQGNTSYRKKLFGLYQEQLKEGMLIDNGQIYLFDYKNIATLGISLHEYNWIEQFTKEYTTYLPLTFRAMASNYNQARIFFAQKKYKEALRLLNQNIYDDIYYALGARSLLIKIYFEQDDLPFLDTVITSFKTYLNRNKRISDIQKKAYINFTSIAYKLARDMDEPLKVKKHLEKFKSMDKVAEENWLKEKIDNLI